MLKKRITMHQRGIEPGPHRWQRCILGRQGWLMLWFVYVSGSEGCDSSVGRASDWRSEGAASEAFSWQRWRGDLEFFPSRPMVFFVKKKAPIIPPRISECTFGPRAALKGKEQCELYQREIVSPVWAGCLRRWHKALFCRGAVTLAACVCGVRDRCRTGLCYTGALRGQCFIYALYSALEPVSAGL